MESLALQIGGFLLVFCRIAGLFMFAPIVASTSIPMQIRALLAACFSVVVWLSLPNASRLVAIPDVVTAGYLVFTEVTLGAVIGFLAMLPVVAVQLAAAISGQQMGFGLASVYNPALETDSDVLGEMFLYLSLGVFLSLSGIEHVFLAVAKSFTAAAPGVSSLGKAPLVLVQAAMTSGTELALRLSLPVLCFLLIETVASSMVAKTMPQLNVMSLGYGIKIIVGVIAIIGSLAAVQHAVREHHIDQLGTLLRWVSGQ